MYNADIALLHCIIACICDSDDAVAEDADSAKLASQNLLLKRLLNNSKASDQLVLTTASTPTSASQSRLSEVHICNINPSQLLYSISLLKVLCTVTGKIIRTIITFKYAHL